MVRGVAVFGGLVVWLGSLVGLAAAPQESEEHWRELVLGIAHGPFERAGAADPRVEVGALPAGFAERVYVPVGAVVHGSLVGPGGSITAVVTVNRTADELWREYRVDMPDRGWRIPDQASGATRSIADVALAWVFCGPSLEAALVTTTPATDGTRLRIDVHPEFRSGHCIDRSSRVVPDLRSAPGLLVTPPPYSGDRSIGACGDYGRSSSGTAGVVPSTADFDDLRNHYESQLEAGGWERVGPDEAPERLVGLWARDGAAAVLLLAPVPGAPACWHVVAQQYGGNSPGENRQPADGR